MNEHEIDGARMYFAAHPVLGKAARFLGEFRDEVNAHSDGWAYWMAPARAAQQLMTLLADHLQAGYRRTGGALPQPTDADLRKAIAPIKAFYTRHGYKAGMQFPGIN